MSAKRKLKRSRVMDDCPRHDSMNGPTMAEPTASQDRGFSRSLILL